MKKRVTKHRMFAWMLSLCMMLPIFCAVLADAFIDDNVLGKPDITVEVNGEDYVKGSTYHEGDLIKVTFKWTEPTGDGEKGWGELPDKFEWPLGDFLPTSSMGGTIYDGNTSIGTWSVNDNGEVVFEFSDEFKHGGTEAREFHLTLEGELPLDPEKQEGGKDYDFQIGGDKFNFEVEYDDTEIKVEKTMSEIRRNDKGQLVSTVTVEVEVDGYAKDIVFCDAMGERLKLADDTITITEKAAEGEEGKDCKFKKVKCTHDPKGSFDLQLDGSVQDKTLIITYDVILGEGAVNEWYKDHNADSIGNTIDGTFTNANGEPGQIAPDDAYINPDGELSLRKTGELVKDGNGEIEWTITFNTGCFGELTDEMIKQLGMGDFGFLDTLGGGQRLTDEFQQKWKDWTADNSYEIPLSDFIGVPNEDGSWTYTLTYRTKIQPGSSYPYSNYVETDGGISNRGNVTDPSKGTFDIHKKFVKENEKAGTMVWTVTVDMPDEDFTTLTITDTPQDDNVNKYGYTHRVVDGSVVVTVDGEKVYADGNFTIEYNGVGFVIVVDAEKNRAFAEQIRGKTVTITLETEAVTADGSNEGSLSSNFNWQNNVEATLSYPSPNKPDTTRKGSDNHEQTGKPDLIKSVEDADEDGVFTWHIQITGTEPFVNYRRTGVTGNFSTFSVSLRDILPEGLSLKGGIDGVHAVLYYPSRTGTVYGDGLKSSEVLDDYLKVQLNGHELRITWTGDGTLEEKLNKLTAGDFPGNSSADLFLAICYQTELDRSSDIFKEAGGEKLYFTNRAMGTVGDDDVGPSLATKDYDVKSALEKKYTYDTNDPDSSGFNDPNYATTNGNYNVRYEIDINKERLTIGDDGDGMITLIDTMGKSLTPILASVQLVYGDTGEPVESGYSWSFDEGSNTLALQVPDGEYYKLIYFAILSEKDLKDPSTADAGNSVEMRGLGSKKTSGVDGPTGVLKPSAGGSSGSSTLTVIKYTNATPQGTKFLEGAEFELSVVLYQNGKFVPDTSELVKDRIITGSVDENNRSRITFTFNIDLDDPNTFHTNHIFCLRETKAPEGFVLRKEPIYFIFTSYNATDNKAELLEAGVEEYDLGEWIYFENEKDPGNLTVSKKVVDDKGEEIKGDTTDFTFTVTLTDSTVNGTYGDMNFVDGVATVSLKGGQSATAEGLPGGIGYTVTERPKSGYTPKDRTKSGEIEPKGTSAAAFTNIKEETGDLKVSKTVVGGSENKTFNFTVRLSDTTINGTYGGMTFTNGVANFTLKHGDSKLATGLPTGIIYTVTESDNEGYTVSSTGASGTITSGKTATAAFTNKKNKEEEPKTGNLIVRKTVSGYAADQTKAFTFTVTLDDDTINGTYGDMTFVNGVANFTLKHGDSKLATGLPAGVHYTVVESDNDGYTVIPIGDKGVIPNVSTADVTFENQMNVYEPGTGNLTVTKRVKGYDINAGREFTFTVTLDDDTINGTYGDMTFVNGVATFTLKHGESKTAAGLPAGITYTVVESDNKGYTVRVTNETGTTYDETITGTIPEMDTAIVKFDNIPSLPSTGGMGTAMFYVLGLLMIIGSFVLMITSKKSKLKI